MSTTVVWKIKCAQLKKICNNKINDKKHFCAVFKRHMFTATYTVVVAENSHSFKWRMND